jgi:hypothetical protein
MSYFKNFPTRYYQFDKDNIKLYTDLSIRPAVVNELLSDYSNLEPYLVEDGETPEIIAYKQYDDVELHWAIMLANNIMSLYEDWPMNEKALYEYKKQKYAAQIDSIGNSVTLDDDGLYEFLDFVGLPVNGYVGSYTMPTGEVVPLKPHHFEDADLGYYSFDSYSVTTDAKGRVISSPTLTPVSHNAYEDALNEAKREIFLPTAAVIRRMKKELGPLVNG